MNTWFKRMLLSYLPVFFVMISLLFLLFFAAFGNLQNRETAKANEVLSEHVIQLVDSTLTTIDQVVTRETVTNKNMAAFAHIRAEADPFLSYEISKKLTELTLIHPIIHSIYFVHLRSQVVLTPDMLTPIDAFSDKTFIRQALEQTDFTWSGTRMVKEFIFNKEEQVVSLTKRVPPNSTEEAVLIVNISVASLQKMLDELYNADVSFIRMTDRGGGLLYSSRYGPEGGQDGLRNVELLSQKDSAYTGWEVQSGITNGRLFRTVSALSVVWLIAGGLTVILGVWWIVYVTRRNYRPVETILNRIRAYPALQARMSRTDGPQGDEFAFIESAVDDLIEQSGSYERQQKEHQRLRRSLLFSELMKGSRPIPSEEWEAELAAMHLPPRAERMAVAVIDIDKYGELAAYYSLRDLNLLKFVLSSVVKETTQGQPVSVWCEWTDNARLTALYLTERQDISLGDAVTAISYQIKQWAEANLAFTVTTGIGACVGLPDELPESYEEALEALSYKPTLGLSSVIAYADVASTGNNGLLPYTQTIRAVSQAFRLGERAWEDALAQLFASIRSDRCSREQVDSIVNDLIYNLYREMSELPAEFQELWRGGALTRLTPLAAAYASLNELQEGVTHILSDSQEAMRTLRLTKTNQTLIREVRAYIESHYSDSQLSLNQLSEAFHIHLKTLSRLFKEQFGEKFVDYLIRVRIEHAKRLLIETQEPVQIICGQVGYAYVNTFIRVFKKITGLTPGDYRKEHRERSENGAARASADLD